MFSSIIFDDEITICWDLDEFQKANAYKLYLDGVFFVETTKTHYSFLDLKEKRRYQVRVEGYIENEFLLKKECVFETTSVKKKLDVTKAPYNAVSDGKTINTSALQKALNDCRKNECVYFPSGTYLTGALDVHSDTQIYLADGATIQGSENEKDYLPKMKSRFEGMEMMCYRSLINIGEMNHKGGYTCKNVVIRGKGTIYGGGRPLALNILENEKRELKQYLEENAEYVKTCENADTIPGRVRGRLIHIANAQNVVLSGITMGYGASWNIHFIYSKDITTYNCTIRSDVLYNEQGEVIKEGVWNGDGWDPDSSENCVVFHTTFDTYDDGVAIKSGKNPEGNIVNRPTKNVYIFDCKGKHGVAVGSELSGGVENVYVWDCEYVQSTKSINLKTTVKRGGYIKNVVVKNCDLMGISLRTSVGFNNDGESARVLTKLEDFHFENLRLKGNNVGVRNIKVQSTPIHIEGFDDGENSAKNITLKNIRISKIEDGDSQRVIIENTKNVTTDIYFE